MANSPLFLLHLPRKHVELLMYFCASWIAPRTDTYSSNSKRNTNSLGIHNVDTGLDIAFQNQFL